VKQFNFAVCFNTPAFLGNAEQNAQWRTPPFKSLLRQWWRVAYAAQHGFKPNDLATMRREEGLLFGVASDGEGESRKSQLRIRLGKWVDGTLKGWDGLEQGAVTHPEAEKANYKVGPHAYLGYGPLDGRGGTKSNRKGNAAIQAGDTAVLSIAMPTTHQDSELRRVLEENGPSVEQALRLIDRFGTLGSRSRNGWGSLALLPLPQAGEGWGEGALPLRPWQDCLDRDWPHAIGQDSKGALIWQTAPHDEWKALMKTLAELKISMRRLFLFPPTQPDGEVHDRHWLSYPVTRHNVRAWDKAKLRLPNSLRFKVRQTADGKLVGIIVHIPHLPPAAFHPDRPAIANVWTQVHRHLDAIQLVRIGE
jgi:CRISPR-associated protein Cmr1